MGSKGTQTIRQVNEPNPQMLAAYLDVVKRAQGAADTPYQPYGGQLVAGLSPIQEQTFGNVQNLISDQSSPIYDRVQNYYSPYQKDVVDATRANIQENDAIQREALRGNAISQGAWGGDRAGVAEAELARKQNLASGQIIAGLQQQGYQQAVAAALADEQRMQQEKLSGIQTGMMAGAQQQGQEQNVLSSAYQQFLNEKAYPFQTAQFLGSVVGGVGPQAGGSATTTQPGPNMLSQIGGLGLTGLGLYNSGALGGIGSAMGKGASGLGAGLGSLAMLSDERVKEDIEKVGNLDDGMPIYKYRYKGDPTVHIGLLAQEVEQTKPNAVENYDGVKYVNYDEATKANGGPVMPYQKSAGYVPLGHMAAGRTNMPQAPTPTKQQTMVESLQAMIPALQMIKQKANGGPIKGFASGGVPSIDEAVSTFGAPNAGIMLPKAPIGLLDAPNSAIPQEQFGVPAAGVMTFGPRELGLPPNAMPVANDNPGPPMNILPPATMPQPEDEGPQTMEGQAPNNDAAMALVAAGLGMMSSRSPFAGVAIGEGGLEGLKHYQNLKQQRLQEMDRATRQKQVEQQAQRLEAQMQQQQRMFEIQNRRADIQERQADIKENQENWKVIGQDANGNSILMNTKTGEQKISDAKIKKELSPADKKAIKEADDIVIASDGAIASLKEALSLNPNALSGPLAQQRGYAWSLAGDESGEATENFTTIINNQALSQLKAIFGAAPTEGERKILLELQAAPNKAPAVREAIIQRAIKAAEERKLQYSTRAEELKQGTFYQPKDQKVNANLKPMTDPMRARAKELIAGGTNRQEVIEELKRKGFDASVL